jgi:hypothetical protein
MARRIKQAHSAKQAIVADDNHETISTRLRNAHDIVTVHSELKQKVWWNRHQDWLYEIETGEEVLTEEEMTDLEMAKKVAHRIEQKYGKENLGWDDFEWGMLCGKMSALGWVLGDEWESSLNT